MATPPGVSLGPFRTEVGGGRRAARSPEGRLRSEICASTMALRALIWASFGATGANFREAADFRRPGPPQIGV